jgi:SepF-like predicted cell division protein (DUF552 family)
MIGYIGKSAHMSESAQEAMLRGYGVSQIVDDLDDAIRAVRPGVNLVVARLVCLASQRDEIRSVIRRCKSNGGLVVEAATDTACDPATVCTVFEAVQTIARRPNTSENMAKIGAKGGKATRRKMTEAEMREIWKSDITSAEAADKIGFSAQQLYRLFGDRGRPAGRPRKRKD